MSDEDTPPETTEQASHEGARIAKVLARAGVCSRRDAEKLIAERRVAVNGQVLESPAFNVVDGAIITVDGKPVKEPEPSRLWRYHKPAGLVTSHRDEKGRATVFSRLPEDMPRVVSVGRLDLNSEGLLLLTNDGDLARRLELPAQGWVRRYRVRMFGEASQSQLDTLKNGVTIDGVNYGPVEATFERNKGANAWATVAIKEGKNREVKRLMEHLGFKVSRLIRVSYGPFHLGQLDVGQVDEISMKVVREQLGLKREKVEGERGGPRLAMPVREAIPEAEVKMPRPFRPEVEASEEPRVKGAWLANKMRRAAEGREDRKPRGDGDRPRRFDHARGERRVDDPRQRVEGPRRDAQDRGDGPRGNFDRPRREERGDAAPRRSFDGPRREQRGDAPSRKSFDGPRREGRGDRPEKSFDRPRGEGRGGDRPRGERRDGDAPRKSFNGPRREGRGGERPRGERRDGDAPRKSFDGPRREGRGDRPEKSFDRPRGEGRGDRQGKSFGGPRGEGRGDRPGKSFGGPRREGRGDRPEKSFDRPRGEERGDRPGKSFGGPRGEGRGDRPSKSFGGPRGEGRGDRPGKSFGGPRKEGRGGGKGFGGPRRDGKPGGPPRGGSRGPGGGKGKGRPR